MPDAASLIHTISVIENKGKVGGHMRQRYIGILIIRACDISISSFCEHFELN